MSYSALFTSGLTLASQPRSEAEAQAASRPSLQINVHPGTPARPRIRKRRSSLTIATSPLVAVKSPLRSASDSLRNAMRSPRESSFLEALQNSVRSKAVRHKIVSTSPPPAPTTPLPTIPNTHLETTSRARMPSSLPVTPTDVPFPSSPIISEPRASWTHVSNPSRKSSSLLPPMRRTRTSSAGARGPLMPNPYSTNIVLETSPRGDLDIDMIGEKDLSSTVWFDEDENMKENGSEA